jgi:hypothetical protein
MIEKRTLVAVGGFAVFAIGAFALATEIGTLSGAFGEHAANAHAMHNENSGMTYGQENLWRALWVMMAGSAITTSSVAIKS